MRKILLLVIILLLLPWTLRAADVTINSQDSTQDTYLREATATTNYGTATAIRVGYDINSCMTGHTTSWVKVNLDGTGYDTCSGMLIITTLGYDLTDGTADTIDVFRCTRAAVVGQATWNIYSTGNSWTTVGGDFDTSHSSGFWQNNGAFIVSDLGSSNVCTLSVPHAGVDSMMQGLLTNNGLILVARSYWRDHINCPTNAATTLVIQSEDYGTPASRPQYVLKDVGIPAAGGPTPQVIIIGRNDAEDHFNKFGSLPRRYFIN